MLSYALVLLASLASPLLAAPAALEERAASYWQPSAAAVKWDYALAKGPYANKTTLSTAKVWGVDLFDTNTSTIADLHKRGAKVICYFSAGSYEDWRSDKSSFPASTLGNDLSGWEGERWVDTRSAAVRAIMSKRIALAKTKSCDGVDPDNVDAYNNDNGLNLTQDDTVSYMNYLADAAHNKSLAIGLKNAGDVIPRVISKMQWSINEECVKYKECSVYQPFITAGKPVFHVEYPKGDDVNNNKAVSAKTKTKVCGDKGAKGFSNIIKNIDLDGWIQFC